MTVQQLIDKLNTIEDKSVHVVHYYDGWYFLIRESDVQEVILYTGDNGINLTDYIDDPDKDIKVKCLQIAHGG